MILVENSTPSTGLVDQVTRSLADVDHAVELVDGQLSTDEVLRVIVAYETFKAGEPAGTLKRDPSTGAIALRVDDATQGPCWRVTGTDGSQYTDMSPTLDWAEI